MSAADLVAWLHRRIAGAPPEAGLRTAPTAPIRPAGELLAEPANGPPTAPANDPGPDHDPDRWCWPHSDAMNGAELARFALRVQYHTRHGMPEAEAERLADELGRTDRQPEPAAAPAPAPAPAPAAPAAPARSCAACTHLTRRGTCLEPVGAGLAQTFGIRWPERGHAARCAAFMPSPAR